MHEDRPVGDPAALEWLWALSERLRRALAEPAQEGALRLVDEADPTLRWLLSDENPRTRAQVRGFVLVSTLVRQGKMGEAAEMLDGEIFRSFPGRAELNGRERGMLE